eukprot:30846-Pelagococcus_subviridis.AAC.9
MKDETRTLCCIISLWYSLIAAALGSISGSPIARARPPNGRFHLAPRRPSPSVAVRGRVRRVLAIAALRSRPPATTRSRAKDVRSRVREEAARRGLCVDAGRT